MKFSFEGSFDELHELGVLISGSTAMPQVKAPVMVEAQMVADLIKEDEPLQIVPTDDPAMDIGESIAKNPCIDPLTGDYFTAFKDMMAACDQLLIVDRKSDVDALLKANSINGTYGGIPPKLWKTVEENALALLKQDKKEPAVSLRQLKELATEFTHSDSKMNKPRLKALLEKYGVKAISTVPEDKRSAFYAELKALHEGD
ncbi:MAG: hypothetical protein HFE68_04980 [Erysipelotrichaceae bacterium]|nr:hypothetical protein [Erysipelotrichaceae bacterium]